MSKEYEDKVKELLEKADLTDTLAGYLSRIVILGLSISDKSKEPDFQKTRTFECLVRDYLAVPKLNTPSDITSYTLDIKAKNVAIESVLKSINGSEKVLRHYLKLALYMLVCDDCNNNILLENVANSSYIQELISTATESFSISDNIYICIRFVAFYALCTHLRRNGYTNAVNSLIFEYYNTFNSFVSFKHIYLESIAPENLVLRDIEESRSLCFNYMPNHSGVQMMYAINVAEYCDLDTDWANTSAGKMYIEEALGEIRKAIEYERNYPKAYIIKARLLANKGEYQDALTTVKDGIRIQLSTRKNDIDYIDRLVDFYDTRFTIEVEEQVARIKKEEQNLIGEAKEQLEHEMKDKDIKMIEILALFTAVIGIIVGGFNSDSTGINTNIILVLFGATIITFTTIHILLDAKKVFDYVISSKHKHLFLRLLLTVIVSLFAYYIGMCLISSGLLAQGNISFTLSTFRSCFK